MKPSKQKKQAIVNPKQSKLQKLVKNHPHFTFIESGKIKCTLTKHQFAPTIDNYEKYLLSKSYKKGVEGLFELNQYEEFLVPFKGSQHFLFCRLTGVKLPKKKTAIDRHVGSRKFKHRLEKYMAEQGQEEEEEDEELEFEGEEEEDEQEEQAIQEEEEEEEEEEVKPVKNGKNGKHVAPKSKSTQKTKK